MDLPNLFSNKRSKHNTLFLSLLLTDKSVQSGLWRVQEEKIMILNKSLARYFGNEEERLVQVDEALLDLGEHSEDTDAVLLALEPSWVNKAGIFDNKKEELKILLKKLNLNAVGFVLTTEAIGQFLLKQNPFYSGVLLYIGVNALELTVYRQGKQTRSLAVGKSDDIVLDLKEAAARLTKENPAASKLPANLVLGSAILDDEKLQNYHQQLLTQDWVQEFNFIQPPVIEIINQNELLSIATHQGGKEVAQTSGLLSTGQTPALPLKETADQAKSVKSTDDSTALSQKDSAEMTSFGIPMSDNLTAVNGTAVADPASMRQYRQQNQLPGRAIPQTPKKPKKGLGLFGARQIKMSAQSSASSPVKNQFTQSPKNDKKKLKLIALMGMAAGVLASGLIYFFYLKNNYRVLIEVEPQIDVLTKNVIITLDPDIDQSDPKEQLLKAELVVKEVADSDTIQTTGVKLVGEKAEGKVIIFNKTSEDKIFEANTVFKSGDLEFSLLEGVTITAAAESEDGETREYGQESATIRAADIGADSNIAIDLKLQIEDFSEDDFTAKVEADFTGGSSREIRVVSEADQQELFVSLRQKLLKQARDEFAALANGDYTTPTEIYQVIVQNYNGEIGEELEELALDLTLGVSGVKYTADDLKLLAQEVLVNDVPEGYEFVDEAPEVMSQPIESETATSRVQIEANLSTTIKATVTAETVKSLILGVDYQEIEQILTSQSTIKQAQIKLSPSLVKYLFSIVPDDQERVLVTVN